MMRFWLVDLLVLSAQGITGKAVTPFLLEHFHTASQGESLKVNIEIIKSNSALSCRYCSCSNKVASLMSIKVYCIGDVMLDIVAQIPTTPHELHLGNDTRTVISTHGGGAGGNVASWLAVLGNDVTMVGRIGNDAAGSAITAEFDALGISYGEIVKEGLHTGVVICLS